MNGSRGGGETPAAPVATARMIVGGQAATMLIVAFVSKWMPSADGVSFLVGPAAIFGIVSPAIGYRLFHLLREKTPPDAGITERQTRFVGACVSALAVTEAAGLLGIVVFAVSGGLSALIGVVSHMILTGALWPTDERLETFLTAAPTER